jgi:hypothetical protein
VANDGEELFCKAALSLLPAFENGKLSRVLHTVAPVLRANVDIEAREAFGSRKAMCEIPKFRRVIELHDAMLGRARAAVDCWSVVGRRRRVVKDMRVTIAMLVWDEAWLWSEKEPGEHDTDEKKAKTG